MAYDNPPSDATPENLLKLCAALSNGSRTLDELADDEDVGFSRSVLGDTIRYGTKMGFISEDQEKNLSLNDRGWDVAFQEEIDEAVEEPFRTGLQEYPLYSDLLDKIIEEELVEEGEPEQISRPQILPLLNRSFGFAELSTDSTLKPATNTFLQTLEAAGYGKHVTGRHGNRTRVEINEDFRELVRADRTGAEGETEQETLPDAELEDEAEEEEVVAEGEETEERKEVQRQIQTGIEGREVNIDIQISSEDWNSDEVIELIEALRNTDGE